MIKIKNKFLYLLGIILSVIIIVFSFNLEGNDYTRKYVLATFKSSYIKYQKDRKEYKETLKELKSFNLEGQLKDLNQEESVYVMIIGESGFKIFTLLFMDIFNKQIQNYKIKKIKKNFLFLVV